MSSWLLLILGIIIGWIIGVIVARQNYETCRKHLARLKKELLEQESALNSSKEVLNRLKHMVD